jgi:hypothetical protein
MTRGGAPALFLLAAVTSSAKAQQPLELTASNFVQAAQQNVAWLIHIEQSSNPQSRAAASLLQPAMAQAAQYFHAFNPKKGVRVAHVDIQTSSELRPILCDTSVCPPLVMYKRGTAVQVYKGTGAADDVVNWVQRMSHAAASPGAGYSAAAEEQASAYRARAAAAAQASVRSGTASGLSGSASTVPSQTAGSSAAAAAGTARKPSPRGAVRVCGQRRQPSWDARQAVKTERRYRRRRKSRPHV